MNLTRKTSADMMAAVRLNLLRANEVIEEYKHSLLLERIDRAILRAHINRLYANQTLPPKKVRRWPL